MIKLIYIHRLTKDSLAKKEYMVFLANGEVYHPMSWEPVLVLFGFIKIKL